MERKSFFKLLTGGIAGLFVAPKMEMDAETIEYGAQMYQRGRRDMREEEEYKLPFDPTLSPAEVDRRIIRVIDGLSKRLQSLSSDQLDELEKEEFESAMINDAIQAEQCRRGYLVIHGKRFTHEEIRHTSWLTWALPRARRRRGF